MTIINISDDIIKEAECYADSCNRSVSKQIEHWSCIGKMTEENPDLTYSFMKDLLLSLEEAKTGIVESYQFDE